jgi:hypothetical protein
MNAKPMAGIGRKTPLPGLFFARRTGTGFYGEQLVSWEPVIAAESRRLRCRARRRKAPVSFAIPNGIVQIL